MKKGSNRKLSYSPVQEQFENLWFVAEDQWIHVRLCHVEAIVHNRYYFSELAFYVLMKGYTKNTYTAIDSRIHDRHDDVNFNFVCHFIGKLQPF